MDWLVRTQRPNTSRGFNATLVLGALLLAVASCSGDAAGPDAPPSRRPDPPAPRGTTVGTPNDGRYNQADVRHTFKTVFDETVDCVDFFAQASVKALIAKGRPVKAPQRRTPRQHPEASPQLPDFVFNGSPDVDGKARACPDGSVPLLRSTPRDPGTTPHERTARKSAPPIPRSLVSSRPFVPESVAQNPTTPTTTPVPPPPPGGQIAADYDGYAHVATTIYPAGTGTSNNLASGSAVLSIYSFTSTQVPNDGSHSLMQLWMTAGSAAGTTLGGACGGSNHPCLQSVEVGWDQDPQTADHLGFPSSSWNKPHLFIYATADGYDNGCYDNINDYVDDELCGATATRWVQTGMYMTPGLVLPASVVGSTPRYELPVEIDGTSSGWYVFAGVNDLSGGGGGYDYAEIGYYPLEYYDNGLSNNLMNNYQGQTFQAGGEVDDQAEKTSGNFTVPMGSNNSTGPSAGYGRAAYVYGIEGCDGTSACYDPWFVTPVTRPQAYTYDGKVTPPWGTAPNYFYLGDGVDTYTWRIQAPLPGGANFSPTLLNAPVPVVRGSNIIPISPVYVYNSTIGGAELKIKVLTNSTDGSGNYRAALYDSYPNGLSTTWTNLNDASGDGLYLIGLASDAADGKFWGWGTGNHVYTNDPSGGIANTFSGFTSVAAASTSMVIGTATSSCTSYTPKGNCIETNSFSSGSWGTWVPDATGASQVTYDTITQDVIALDNVGKVWRNDGFIGNGKCGMGTVTFSMVAAQNGTVFGLTSGGDVYFLGGVSPSCWSVVDHAGFDTFVAIATDNGLTEGVWAVDSVGVMYSAE